MTTEFHSPEVDDRQERFPGYAEELSRHRERERALKMAWATPLPGPLREAFCDPHAEVSCGRLRAVTLGDLVLLGRLKSPLVGALIAKMAGEEYVEQPKAIALDDFEVAEALLLWSRPHIEVRRLLDGSSRAFRKQAVSVFSRVREGERPVLAEQIVLHLFRAFRTSVALRASQGSGAETVIQYGEGADGFGWWLCVLGTMMRDFGMSRDYALEELPLAQALALQAWSQYSSGLGLELESDGYIAQEAASGAGKS